MMVLIVLKMWGPDWHHGQLQTEMNIRPMEVA